MKKGQAGRISGFLILAVGLAGSYYYIQNQLAEARLAQEVTLQICYETFAINNSTYSSLSETIQKARETQSEFLKELRYDNPDYYPFALIAVKDKHDTVPLPNPKVDKPKTKKLKDELTACETNKERQSEAIVKLHSVAKDTNDENKWLKDILRFDIKNESERG